MIPPDTDVIVLGLHLNGAAKLRGLAKLGYSVCGMTDLLAEIGMRSRHGAKIVCPDPLQDFIAWSDFMDRLGARCAKRPALIPTADRFVLALDRAAERLAPSFRFLGFGNGLRTTLTAKLSTIDLARRHGVPVPLTRVVSSSAELRRFCEEARWPVLIKPDLSVSWHAAGVVAEIGYRKAVAGNDVETLVAAFEAVQRVTPRAVAQEVIVGPDPNHVTWAGFVGPGGQVGGRMIARKLRILPIHYGSGSFVRIEDMPELEALGERFLREIGYEGICCMSFKIDERDGTARLFEINPRSGLWDAIGVPVGIDFGREKMAALLGQPTLPRRPVFFGQKWVYLAKDLSAFRHYRDEGSLGFWQWARSLTPPLMVSDLPLREDPPLAWASLRALLSQMRSSFGR